MGYFKLKTIINDVVPNTMIHLDKVLAKYGLTEKQRNDITYHYGNDSGLLRIINFSDASTSQDDIEASLEILYSLVERFRDEHNRLSSIDFSIYESTRCIRFAEFLDGPLVITKPFAVDDLYNEMNITELQKIKKKYNISDEDMEKLTNTK